MLLWLALVRAEDCNSKTICTDAWVREQPVDMGLGCGTWCSSSANTCRHHISSDLEKRGPKFVALRYLVLNWDEEQQEAEHMKARTD